MRLPLLSSLLPELRTPGRIRVAGWLPASPPRNRARRGVSGAGVWQSEHAARRGRLGRIRACHHRRLDLAFFALHLPSRPHTLRHGLLRKRPFSITAQPQFMPHLQLAIAHGRIEPPALGRRHRAPGWLACGSTCYDPVLSQTGLLAQSYLEGKLHILQRHHDSAPAQPHHSTRFCCPTVCRPPDRDTRSVQTTLTPFAR